MQVGIGSGRWAALVIALAVLLHAPSLGWGFFVDDYNHQLVLSGRLEHPSMKPWSVYDFGTVDDLRAIGREAHLPFWTSPDWKARFLRPLTSLSLWLDHALFGANAVGGHATSLAWLALWLLLAWRLYLALGLPARAAGWGLLFLALEDGKLLPVGWLANRNSLLEAAFTTAAVLAVARVRPRGAGLAAGLALSAAAMLCKESGVVAPVLVALWLVLDARRRGDLRSSRAPVLACAGLAGLWLAYLLGAGYGTHSRFYPTPWGEPREWLAQLGVLVPTGALAMLSPFSPEPLLLHPEWTAPCVALSVLVVVPVAVLAWRAARALPFAPLLAAWPLLTLLPRAGAPPSDRLLDVPMIGAAALLGLLVQRALDRDGPMGMRGRGPRAAAWALVVLAGPLSGLSLLGRGIGTTSVAAFLRSTATEAEVGEPREGGTDAVVLTVPSQFAGLALGSVFAVETGRDDVRFRTLQMARRGLRWIRVGERSFELESLDEPFLTAAVEGVFLARAERWAPGRTWTTDAFAVTAAGVEDGRLVRLRFDVDRPLEDPSLRFLAWRDGRLARVEPPPIGAATVLPAPAPPFPLLP